MRNNNIRFSWLWTMFILLGVGFVLGLLSVNTLAVILFLSGLLIMAGMIIRGFYNWIFGDYKYIFKFMHRPLFSIFQKFPWIVNTWRPMVYDIELNDKSKCNKNHTNKLFGYSIGFGVHENSFRISYNDKTNKFLAYCYVNGQRLSKEFKLSIAENRSNKVKLSITRKEDYIKLEANHLVLCQYDVFKVYFTSKKMFGLKLGLYYGGKARACKLLKIFMLKR